MAYSPPTSTRTRERLERENARLLVERTAALNLNSIPPTSTRTRERLSALEAENAALRAAGATFFSTAPRTAGRTRVALEAARAENAKLQASALRKEARTSTATLEALKRLEAENMRRRSELQTIDVLYMIDCTGSMAPWIREAAAKVVDVAQHISHKFQGYKVRFGFLGYRDFDDGSDRFTELPFTTNVAELQAKLDVTKAKGGGDGPEDVLGALAKAAKLPWSARTRVLYHIADAPSHFSQFNDDPGDDYPSTDPDGRSHLDAGIILRALGELNIDYHFVQAKKTYTEKMIKEFSRMYDNKPALRVLQVLDLGWDTTKFLPTVVETITASVSRTILRSESESTSSTVLPDVPLITTIDWGSADTWGDLVNARSMSCNPAHSLQVVLDTPLEDLLKSTMDIYIRMQPFASGTQRYAFPMYEPHNNRRLVAKVFKRGPADRENYLEVMSTQSIAYKLANEFNTRRPPRPIDFLDVRVLEIRRPSGGIMYVTVEPFVEGNYVKHNNNANYSNELKVTAQAYSHFTWEASNNQLIVVDLQGVEYIMTDPVIHSANPLKDFGSTDLGLEGINLFFSNHRCNFVCKHLGLGRHPCQPSGEISTATEDMHRILEAAGPREVNCAAVGCGRIITLTTNRASAQSKTKSKANGLCDACNERLKEKHRAVCEEPGCDVMFEFQPYWFTAKGMAVPKRCSEHRGKRNAKQQSKVVIN
ncbi:hypothetical protein BC936DRAFT_148790 [Jimgerdemannia flammicorona]|uniref:Alpha-type protein kinase domain-containing protein n=1 Tax=Jimgerdemannia flammicorona TaxID=994334 RepID=A0A433D2G6_9FUNG|nr:hypothetical protein BC936DRAFT_148790 [Jimgerdemannia flammicorona]